MNLYHIEDYGLTAQQLQQKYDPTDPESAHRGYQLATWRVLVYDMETILGYWDWVVQCLEVEADELEKDSPYNGGTR